jgi:catechol 2,3-dioxygenase-like lactoylglutathione lyase family enzyme
MKRTGLLFLLLVAACHSARPPAAIAPLALPAIAELELTVSDLARATDFFVDGLAFRPAGRGHVALGDEAVALRPAASGFRPVPTGSRANDLVFEHMAIVVADMDAAYARVQALGAHPISAGPQTIPRSNPAAGGIRAYYFRDADGHSLELIWYPDGKGDPRWQARDGRLFLGVDHTAIAVADTERSLGFYRDLLGLEVKGHSLNEGREQELLSGVPGARVRITGLRGGAGPGVELLEYLAPRDGLPAPADTRPDDAWYWQIVVAVDDPAAVAARLAAAGVAVADVAGVRVARDPDGHHVRLVARTGALAQGEE